MDMNKFLAPMFPPTPLWMTDLARELIIEAENRYGSSDDTYQFMGVVADPDGPRIRFGIPNDKMIYIAISSASLAYENQAMYQIAHEVIHLLAPNRNPPTTLFEEGLAVWFSIFVPNFPSKEYQSLALSHLRTNPSAANYRLALDLFNEVQGVEPEAARKIRAKKPQLYNLTSSDVIEAIPTISKALADRICQRIQMR